MIRLKETAGVSVNAQFVPVNEMAGDKTVNKGDLQGQLCLRGKAAWMLGLSGYRYIKIYIYFLINIFSPHVCETPSYSTPLFCLRNSIFGLNYHNAVATAVAGKKVANV